MTSSGLTIRSELALPIRMFWSDGMPMGLFTGRRTYRLEPTGGGMYFSMTEEFISNEISPDRYHRCDRGRPSRCRTRAG